MLEIRKVSWQNFLSYGDYPTEIDFTDLGQCLITGEVLEDESKEVYDSGNPIQAHKSNGAGKSTIASALQWGLFGRTMHSAAPGAKVVNWFTGKDCWVRVEFKNGDSITRTRNTDNLNEVLVCKDGEEVKFTSESVSTGKIQQQRLMREFGLDWDIICGSVFFNQYGRSWMEMADQVRKKAIERILHIDRFLYYAKIAKDKADALEARVARSRDRLEDLQTEIIRLDGEIVRLTDAAAGFVTGQKQRQRELLQAAVVEKENRDKIILPDLDKLRGQWEVVRRIEEKIAEYREKSDNIGTAISEKLGTINSLKSRVKSWEAKGGKVCVTCEQEVQSAHTRAKIDPLTSEIEKLGAEVVFLQAERAKVDAAVNTAKQTVAEKKPGQSIGDANGVHTQWRRHDDQIKRLKASAAKVDVENNPHEKSLSDAQALLVAARGEIVKAEKEVERDTFLCYHYWYIHKAYNDRTKIKSYVFQDHIPFINGRLRHYLDVFGLDVQVELTPSLGIQSNLWGYDFESGGERKRTDVAFMLAMFDFHEQMYGRQCNIMILDEVDGRLDDDGIDALINVIKNDLAPKVEAILIISHRQNMFDMFPKQICVERKDRFSYIKEIV